MNSAALFSTLLADINVVIDNIFNPPAPAPAPAPAPVPAGLDLNTHPQQAETHAQAIFGPVMNLPVGLNLRVVGILNGEPVYEVVEKDLAPPLPVAPIMKSYKPRKRKLVNQQEGDRPYIKKPPNAFMLFMEEQRPYVVTGPSFECRGNAAVNKILGQRWTSMTHEEQDDYYNQAGVLRRLHAQQHPEWSARENYGKKRARERRKASTGVEASASAPEDVTQQAKRLCVTPVQTAVMQPFTSQAAVMQPSTSQAAVMQSSLPPHRQQ
ncbi:transcription factor 7-like 1 [Cottoperca gobio]|uniref:Transcription factor 7-like 1 n=1 Tax=Cottoperca gobio TaxID=56716 RepID=A0A6J2QPC7_COTGO|nr:transcription factor 7-like 1 [Cottoperca gobio]